MGILKDLIDQIEEEYGPGDMQPIPLLDGQETEFPIPVVVTSDGRILAWSSDPPTYPSLRMGTRYPEICSSGRSDRENSQVPLGRDGQGENTNLGRFPPDNRPGASGSFESTCTRGGSDIQNRAGTEDLWARPYPLAVRIMNGGTESGTIDAVFIRSPLSGERERQHHPS